MLWKVDVQDRRHTASVCVMECVVVMQMMMMVLVSVCEVSDQAVVSTCLSL
jgi:hypothetical protein